MAFAMMGGIIVGTLLTLLFLPALYIAWFRVAPPMEFKAKRAATIAAAPQRHGEGNSSLADRRAAWNDETSPPPLIAESEIFLVSE
jgi:hypothetical protein